MQASQIGRKARKTWSFEARLKRRTTPPVEFRCVCGVTATSDADMEAHQRAKQHGRYAPRSSSSSAEAA